MSAWEYDPKANAAYLHLSPDRDTPAVRQVNAVGDEIILDFSAEGRIIGVEVLRASELLDPRLLEG
ncbi:DUF2283 domain-containing protein [Corynebacterium halotolerans]|uniref:DUF2283 domain-containing protein n=1 Tax=Corynebacterium halotolerans YIM 70093 = DSM 44683 TaxID=1121362 RepID=M1P5L6_9CORY|nr:DUF2283 domain-containing protein [Corynebacterium halotolerans]AGF71941.1 hypothetical protein A605_04665 [Corynebacterium halotolerans YIM 70093 = DSM 44683]